MRCEIFVGGSSICKFKDININSSLINFYEYILIHNSNVILKIYDNKVILYNAIYNGSNILFYYGNSNKCLLGDLLSFYTELAMVPNKIVVALNNNIKLTSKNQTTNIINSEISIKSEKDEKSDIKTLVSDTKNLLHDIPCVSRLSKFKNQDFIDKEIEQDIRKKIIERLAEEENEEIMELNKIYNSEHVDVNKDDEKLDQEAKELLESAELFYNKLNSELDEEEEILKKDIERVVDLDSELRELKNKKSREKEKEFEKRKIYISDKRSFLKIKNDVEDPKKKYITRNNIPPLFQAKYPIFEFMEKNNLIDFTEYILPDPELDELEYKLYSVLYELLKQFNDDLNSSEHIELDIDIPEELLEICDSFLNSIKNDYFLTPEKIMEKYNETGTDNDYSHIFKTSMTEN